MTDESINPGGEAVSEIDGNAEGEAVDTNDFESFESGLDANEGEELGEGEGDEGSGEDTEGDEVEKEPAKYTVKVNGEEREVTLEDLQSGYMMNADYTRKTQEVAETRKAAEERLERLNAIVEMSDQERQAETAIATFNQQIAQLQNVNLEHLSQTDPVKAQQIGFRLQNLMRQRDQISGALQEHKSQLSLKREEASRTALEQGRAELAKKIKGYSPELENKLADFGERFGFGREEILDAVADPRSIEILHLAFQGEQARAQQKKTQKLAAGQQTKPVKTLRGTSGRFKPAPDTNDFSAFEKLADETLSRR